jgi:hypothetical protein
VELLVDVVPEDGGVVDDLVGDGDVVVLQLDDQVLGHQDELDLVVVVVHVQVLLH